jgi:acyl-CoA thioesterase II
VGEPAHQLDRVDAEVNRQLADLFVVSGQGTECYATTTVISNTSVYGGQLFGLAVVAAARSAEGAWVPVSLQAQMLDRGEAGAGIDISVTTLRDGRSTLHRNVAMSQGGRPVAAFQVALERVALEDASSPPGTRELATTMPAGSDRKSPFEEQWGFDQIEVIHEDPEAIHPLWVRSRLDLPDDPAQHAAAIAFVSDMAIVMVAHKEVGDVHARPVTVDHTLWFYGVPRFDDWLYLDVKLSARHGEHALVLGTLTDTRGNLVASMGQGVRVIPARASRPV